MPQAPFSELGEHFAVDLPGARAVFTTRRGGHSVGPYASFNLGFATDDDPDAMARNRAELAAAIGSPEPRFTYQVHGAEVRRITAGTGGIRDRLNRPRADGQATNLSGVAMAALVADCLPIAVAGGGAAAMVHAGWRGLEGGVIAAGVNAVRELATEGDEPKLAGAIGPGAGPCCYEVGDEVHAAFAEYSGVRRGDNLDLKEIARRQLLAAGVSDVYDITLCTLCAPLGLLYSHRRDGGVTGRQAGVAWLT